MNPTELPSIETIDAILEEKPVYEGVVSTDEERVIATKLWPLLLERITRANEVVHTKAISDEITALRALNATRIEEELAKLRKAEEPLTPEEMGKLLSQDYMEFPLTLRERGSKKEIQFTLSELTVTSEKKVLSALQRTISVILKEVQSVSWTADSTNLQKMQQIIELVPGAIDVLSEVCATCLNPDGEKDDITGTWVMNNLSVNRMYNILATQALISRWRDFFLHAYQAIPR